MTTFFTWMFKTNIDNKPYETLDSIEYGQIEPLIENENPTSTSTDKNHNQISSHQKKQFNKIHKYYSETPTCPTLDRCCEKPYNASNIVIYANCMINRHINGKDPITDPEDIHNLLVLRDRITLVFDTKQ